MKTTFLLLFSVLLPAMCSAEPVILGISNQHPLTEAQVGDLLLTELRCTACHQHPHAAHQLERTAPDLSNVGTRVAPDYLRQFIASPATAHHGTTMPNLLSDVTEAERSKIAEAVTHFLVAQSKQKFQHGIVADDAVATGKSLFHSVGCVACHAPRDDSGKELQDSIIPQANADDDEETKPKNIPPAAAINLSHLPAKYSLDSLSAFLFQPQNVRASGRMPDMKLSPAEAKSVASYLLGKNELRTSALEPQTELVTAGKQYFQSLNCAACHQLTGISTPAKAVDLQTAKLDRGCLSNQLGKHPHYQLSDKQVSAIRAALSKPTEEVTDKSQLNKTLTAFNCLACHIRDELGGVSLHRNSYFQTDAKNLGEDARIPPPLTLAGAKLHTVWMKKVLFDGESVRPYMYTRMPQFGEPNLRQLPELFAKLDHVAEVKMTVPNGEGASKEEREQAKELREAGKKLLGNTSLNCVACHNFNGKTPQNNGIELMTTHQRLKPSWFYQFLCAPNNYRPRIVMPVAWPDGKAVDKTVLDGDTHRQIEAIWYYLSLGRSAADPAGVQSQQTRLLATDQARTYRGRSSVAGYRGIAVGFPEQMNFAFNAETGTLTAIWPGEFVRVDRSGQGSGSFNPIGKHISLAQDVSFYQLPDEQTAWPLRPVMNKEAPVNPNPLYPKNLGYQFKGYYFDDQAVPTLMYRSGDLEIEDRSTAATGRINRTIVINSPRQQSVWFRALTGKIETVNKQQFKTNELQLSIPATHTLLRTLSEEQKTSELLLKLDVPQGKSTWELNYELPQ
jgi:mono/diheme cytochrome c family protein